MKRQRPTNNFNPNNTTHSKKVRTFKNTKPSKRNSSKAAESKAAESKKPSKAAESKAAESKKPSKRNSSKAAESKAAESNQESPPGKNITKRMVPVMHYPLTSKDSYDGIIFLVAHSGFKGKLCHIPTKKDMKQQTLLIANIGNACSWFSNPKMFDSFIKARFSDALSYNHLHIEHFIHVVKEKIKKIPTISKRIDTIPTYKSFFDTRGKFSQTQDEYCERAWHFFNEDSMKTPVGSVLLLSRDKMGVPRFKNVYKDEINKSGFILTKTQLYDKLYDEYNLRNVLLIDFGCTLLDGVNEDNIQKLKNGRFGGNSIS